MHVDPTVEPTETVGRAGSPVAAIASGAVGVIAAVWVYWLMVPGIVLGAIAIVLGVRGRRRGFREAGSIAVTLGIVAVLLVPSVLAIAAMAGYATFEALWLLGAVVAAHSIADAFTMPANQLAIAKASGSDQLATGQGLLGAVGLATAAAAAGGGGWIYAAWGPSVLYAGTALAMAALLTAAWVTGRELREPV